MKSLPNLNQLRTFEVAARLESFVLAAQELHVTPSAVSHQIKALEAHFGRPLFTRENRQVRPSREGQRLQEALARVFGALASACSEVALPEGAQVLAVHCSPSFAVKCLGPRLPRFIERHPEITIRLTTGAEPLDLLTAREVDVAISYGQARERPGVTVLPMGSEAIAPLVSPSLLGAEAQPAELILRLPLIDSPLSPVTWPDWFAWNGLTFPARTRPSFDRAALAISAAADGMGIALESTRLAEKELARGELVVLGAGVFREIRQTAHFLSVRADERDHAPVTRFLDWLQSEWPIPGPKSVAEVTANDPLPSRTTGLGTMLRR